ncbi:uncharacterized protein CUNH22orf46 isoform X1 [Oryctolagus cuniculus]|uniref:uncharacterized protein CUNH22orf46 isoform X1 n=1 Tax=Oryctolagus cuniculus TaxID=9986 RepID=UPI00387A2952
MPASSAARADWGIRLLCDVASVTGWLCGELPRPGLLGVSHASPVLQLPKTIPDLTSAMLLPLLGACALVGPCYGPEWEPVQDLLSQNRSCRDPRCRGNLLILCLFLVWQVQHYWYKVTRTRSSVRKVIKVPPEKGVVPSTRCETFFRLNPEAFSSGQFRGLDAHVLQWAHRQRWGSRRSLQKSWTQCLLSRQHPCQGPLWGVRSLSEPTFCTTSFSSTCLLSQDSSWEAQRVPWYLSDGQTRPALDICQRKEQLLVHSQERLVPPEPAVGMRSLPTSMTLAISLPNLPSAHRLQFCSRGFLPDLSNQPLGMSTWESRDCPQEAGAAGNKTQTVSREDGGETQAPGWADQRENAEGVAWEIQAFGGQLPVDLGMGSAVEPRILECGNQRLKINETDGEILIPGQGNQEQMRTEDGAKNEEPKKRVHEEAGAKNLPETQAHMGENPEQITCKSDVETQTPEWGNWDKNGVEGAVETEVFKGNNEEGARGGHGELQAHGLGKQGQSGGEGGEETQMPEERKQDQGRGDAGARVQAEEGRNKDQAGGEDAAQTPTSRRENLGEVKREDDVESQALKWEKQEHNRGETVPESQTPGGERQGQGGSEKDGKIQVSWGENQKASKPEMQVEWGNQALGRGEGAGETQTCKRATIREIRVEDWVVIRAPWWGNQRLAASKIDRKYKMPCCGDQKQTEGERTAEIQALEEEEQRKCGCEDGASTLAPPAKIQGQLRCETALEVHPAGQRNKEWFGDENGTDSRVLRKRDVRGVRGEDGTETQELGEENQRLLGSKLHAKIDPPKWKNQDHAGGTDGADPHTSEVENWGEATRKIDGETHSAAWKTEEPVGGESVAESQIQGKRNLRQAGGEHGTGTWAPGVGNQRQLGNDTAGKIHLPGWENQEPMGDKDGAEIQVPEKEKCRDPGGDPQRPERENQGQSDGEKGGSHSPGRRRWEKTAENQASEKRSQREAQRRKRRLQRKNQRLPGSKVSGKTCSSVWESPRRPGGGNGAKTQPQGRRILRGTPGAGGTVTQAPGGDGQGPLGSEIDQGIQTQGQGSQNKGGDEDAAETQGAGSQRGHRAQDAGEPRVPRTGSRDRVSGQSSTRARRQVGSSGGEGPAGRKRSLARTPDFPGPGYAAEAAEASTPAPWAEMKPLPCWGEAFLLASGEGEHLASQGLAPVSELRSASQHIQPESQRQQSDKGMGPEKASSRKQQPRNPESLAAPLGVRSGCPCLLGDQPPPAATALTGIPTALTVSPKWPVLKKSKRLLLESLMRRRIAHLQWGLPRRILESYLLYNFFGSCSVPLAGVRPSGLCMGQEFQGQQERRCEAQSAVLAIKSPKRPQRLQSPGSSSELPAQATALEEDRLKPVGISFPPPKPRRSKPPGGTREPQVIQEALPRAKLPASSNFKPAAETRSWCGPERVREPCSENSRCRNAVRPEISQAEARAPWRGRTLSFGAGHGQHRKEHVSWGACKPSRLRYQQLAPWRRGSLDSVEGRGAGQKPASSSTNSPSFKGSLHATAARLSVTILSKMSWSPRLAKPQPSAPDLSPKDPESESALLPKADDPHAGEDSVRVRTAAAGDLQPPGPRETESPWGQGAPGHPNRTSWNPLAPHKLAFTRHWRDFLLQCGLKK